MHLPAVYITSIKKTLTVERVIYRIEQQELAGNQVDRKSKQYMTWHQVLQYFTNQSQEDQLQHDELMEVEPAQKKKVDMTQEEIEEV